MNKLRIERKDIYEIEVNDNGDTICFDMADIELPFKLQAAYDGIQKAQKDLQGKLVIIQKQQDHKDSGALMSKNEADTIKAWKKCFKDMRTAMDKFLGENGCQKIFGDANYLEMYDDLFEELSKKRDDGLSHLDHMKITNDGLKKRIEEKYSSKNAEVI